MIIFVGGDSITMFSLYGAEKMPHHSTTEQDGFLLVCHKKNEQIGFFLNG